MIVQLSRLMGSICTFAAVIAIGRGQTTEANYLAVLACAFYLQAIASVIVKWSVKYDTTD